MNRLLKEINRLLSKRNVKYLLQRYYWETVAYSKLRFSKFKKFISGPVFGQVPMNFQTCCNLKIRRLGANCAQFFYLILFLKRLWHFKVKQSRLFVGILKSNTPPWFLWNKNINFNKNKTELKMENPTHIFWEMNLMLQLV